MLLQTNSYIVPRDKRSEHARLLRRFRQSLLRLGCDHFEVYEQVGANWNTGDTTGRFVQIMRFRDRKHQIDVQTAEKSDPIAQQLVQEFCELINFPYQQTQGLFAVGFYTSFMKMPPARQTSATQFESNGANGSNGGEEPIDLAAHQPAEAGGISPMPEPGDYREVFDEVDDELHAESHSEADVAPVGTPTMRIGPAAPDESSDDLDDLLGDDEEHAGQGGHAHGEPQHKH